MRLLILRHAKAEKGTAGTHDRDRALNPRGLKDSARIGAYLARHALTPDQALVSPSRRTRETWSAVAPELAAMVPAFFEDRLYHAGADQILEVIRETRPSIHTLIVVGHNPGMHAAAQNLIASGEIKSRERLNEGLPTAGLAVIDFAGQDWAKLHPQGGRLERFVTPRLLRSDSD